MHLTAPEPIVLLSFLLFDSLVEIHIYEYIVLCGVNSVYEFDTKATVEHFSQYYNYFIRTFNNLPEKQAKKNNQDNE